MTFSRSIKTCLIDKYFTFTGRASRSEYWWFILFILVISIAVIAITEVMGSVLASDIANWVLMALTTIPTYAAGARRLQDTGRSGWWQVLLVPNLIVQALPQDASFGFYDALYGDGIFIINSSVLWGIAIALIAVSLVLLIWTIQRGTDGPNRYGDDPLQPETDADVFA